MPNSTIEARGMTLHRRTARGLMALAVASIFKYGIQFVRMAILARLLAPSDFGAMGLGLFVVGAFETVLALGPDKYLVQKRELEPSLIGTAWALRIAIGMAICIATILIAPAYAKLVAEPQVVELLCIIAVASALKGLKSPGTMLAERELKFSTLARFETSIATLEFGFVLAFALMNKGALALAYSLLATACVEVATSYWVFPFSQKPALGHKALKELLGIGGRFLVISIGSFVMVQGDNLIVGSLLGSASLGQYIMAYRLSELPLQITAQVTGRVALSAFSRVQHDVAQRTKDFLSMFELQLDLLVFTGMGLVTLADSAVGTLFGANWTAAVPCLRALGIVVFWRGLSNLIAPFLIANGHYNFAASIKVVETAVFVAGVSVGAAFYGIVGAALGAGLGYFVAGCIRLLYVIRKASVPAKSIGKIVAQTLVCAIPGGTGALSCDIFLPYSPMLRMTLGAVVLMTGTVLMTITFRRNAISRLRQALTLLKSTPSTDSANTSPHQ